MIKNINSIICSSLILFIIGCSHIRKDPKALFLEAEKSADAPATSEASGIYFRSEKGVRSIHDLNPNGKLYHYTMNEGDVWKIDAKRRIYVSYYKADNSLADFVYYGYIKNGQLIVDHGDYKSFYRKKLSE